MTDQRRKKRNTPVKVPEHVFIAQGPECLQQDQSRLVSSQARRFQSASKRQQQRLAARNEAGYAQSLVGWRSASTTPSVEGRERVSVSPLKSKSPDRQRLTREVEPGETSEAPINLAIRTGIRSDPFSSFPSSNTTTVMLLVDYYIHVWAPHKAGNFDDLMGYNTQLDLCWPVALQDDMLFDATMAVSRAAWLLAQGRDPSEDEFMLHHRGLAMTSLRQQLSRTKLECNEAVLFTIGRMISIAYMSNESQAFIAHYDAFSTLVKRYIDENPQSDVARVLENRLDSWEALHEYRTGQNLLHRGHNRSQSRQSTPQPKREVRGQSPALLSGLRLSVDMAQSLQMLTQALYQQTANPRTLSNMTLELVDRGRQFCNVLRTSDALTPTDLQLGCALAIFCSQLCDDAFATAGEARDGAYNLDDHLSLNDLARTFINQKLDGFFQSDEQKMALTWSALVLGSCLLQQPDNRLRTKGHIIHVNLSLHLGLGLACHSPALDDDESNGWMLIASLLSGNERMGALWHPDLVPKWRQDWQDSMKRQRRWEKQGVWMIGAPKRLPCQGGRSPSKGGGQSSAHVTPSILSAAMSDRYGDVDIIEYLVVREARDSLPMVE